MGLILCFFAVLCVLLACCAQWRRKCCTKKILNASKADKSNLLNRLLEPFGLSYLTEQDIFTTRTDAWQSCFGYSNSKDQNALSKNMDFDCEPVYFNYQGKTWLVEFWKGQYGISSGAEAGVYRADTIIPPALRGQTTFKTVNPNEWLQMSLRLSVPGYPLFQITRRHWWLGGFIAGICTPPEELSMDITVTFIDAEMCASFVRSLLVLGYKESELSVVDATVHFRLVTPKSTAAIPWDSWVESYVLWKAGMICKLYVWFTRPFSSVLDRMLFLKYYCPAAFKRVVRARRF